MDANYLEFELYIIYHDSGFHFFTAVAHVLHAEMTQTFVKEPALLLPHFTLRVDDACTIERRHIYYDNE